MNNNFYTNKELKKLGFKKIGNRCKVSRNAFFYNLKAEIGNNIRIDDLVTLKGKIKLKNNIHIAKGSTLSGGSKGIEVDSFTSISNYTQIFSESDNYSSPSIPTSNLTNKFKKKFSDIIKKKINIGKCVLIGSTSVILPGAKIDDYSSCSAFSVIYKKIPKGFYLNSSKELKEKNLNKIKSLYTIIKKRNI